MDWDIPTFARALFEDSLPKDMHKSITPWVFDTWADLYGPWEKQWFAEAERILMDPSESTERTLEA
jgi:hypothetical protein